MKIQWTSLIPPPEIELQTTEKALGCFLPPSFSPYIDAECWTKAEDHDVCIRIEKPLYYFHDHPYLSLDGFYDLSDILFNYQARMDEDPDFLHSKPKIIPIGYDSGRGRFHLFYEYPTLEPNVIWFSEDDSSHELFDENGDLNESCVIRVRSTFQTFINELITRSIYE